MGGRAPSPPKTDKFQLVSFLLFTILFYLFSLHKKCIYIKLKFSARKTSSFSHEKPAKILQNFGNTKNKFCVIIRGNDAFGVNICEFVRDS